MEAFLGYLLIALVVLLLFGAAIFVHEFGHYWVARRCGMVVLEFAIGFGPKVLSWTVQGIQWSLRWIPAGGFVKLPQMLTSEAIEGKADGTIPPASPWKRIAVAAAGPAMNLVFAFAIASILYFIGLPVLQNDPIIGRVAPDSPEGRAGVQAQDRIVAVNGTAVKSWQEVSMEVIVARSTNVDVTFERAGKRITVPLPTKASSALGDMKFLDLEPLEKPIIGGLDPEMPAAKVGLLPGDKFYSFDGVYVANQDHLVELVGKSQGKECEVVVERDGKRLSFRVTPIYDSSLKPPRIGIAFAGGHYVVQRPGPTPIEQFREVFQMLSKTVFALYHSSETGVKAKDMSGPVGILGSLAVEAKTDFRRALRFMVLVNLNLAILNLLPLPVLDGGHILMALYEIVTRRRVSVRLQEVLTMGFAVLLISFMAYVTYFDITKRVPLFKALLSQDSVVDPSKSNATPNAAPTIGPAPTPAPAK